MDAAPPWRTRPVFISSTFKDMHAERDYLRHHVFPRLEEKLRDRRHTLEPIDLRLGVETAEAGSEEARELLVLKVCLEEVRRSRPFFVVISGDRYGWTPPEDRLAAATREQGFEIDVRGRSVTALEIEFGILMKDPDQRQRSLFFFRDPLPYADMPTTIAACYSDAHSDDPREREGHAKLRALKDRLQKDPELGPRVHRYQAAWDGGANRVVGLEAFGQLVFDELWKVLDEETRAFASQPPPTWEEEERAALAEFVEHRSRDFTGRAETLRQLLGLARSPTTEGAAWGACVTGAPGSGKSALFAHIFRDLTADGGVLVLANAAGGTPRGAQVDAMLRRWIGELADYLRVESPPPDKATPDDVDAAFLSLLRRASGKTRVVALLDALDQAEPTARGQHLTWLKARQWPTNARIIATALPGPAAEALTQWAGVEEVALPPLTPQDAEQIAPKVWRRYHRELNPDLLRLLMAKKLPDGSKAAGNPLWLTLALEQLNLLDADDFARAEREFRGTAEERLRAMVLDTAERMPPSVAELYGWLLAQNEKVFGTEHARAFAAVIALGRFGWRETDLLALVPRVARLLFPDKPAEDLDDLRLAALRRGFRAHLVRRGTAGQLDFFHAQMRRAVETRSLKNPEVTQAIHAAIADHLESLSATDSLRVSELMVHLTGNGDAGRAARCYANLPAGPPLANATQVLALHVVQGQEKTPNPHLDWITTFPDQPGLSGSQVQSVANQFNFDLNDALENVANLSTRQTVLAAARHALERLSASDPSNAGWQRDLSLSRESIGDVLQAQGDLAGALREYRAGLQVHERLSASDPLNAGWQRDLSGSQDRIGNVLQAQGDLAGALREYRAGLQVSERLSASDPSNAGWQRDLSVSQEKIGNVLQAQGDLAGALREYRAGLQVRERLSASDPSNAGWQRDLWVSCWKIASALEKAGDASALTWWRRTHDILFEMQSRGLFVSPGDAGVLEQLRKKLQS
jgi:tetratricopeptide (TPR) repeat protein